MSEKMVKQDMMIIVALVALVVGFLIGVVFSSTQSGPGQTQATSQQPIPQAQNGSGVSPAQASQILSLENEVAANPQSLQAWTSLGHIYFDTNRFAKAIVAYNRSLELDPKNADVWTDLGVMYRRNNQFPEAINAFERATSLSPTHEQARFNKGIVYLYDLKDNENAKKAWGELLTINPVAMAPNGKSVKELLATIE